jgi:hypothetical protein
MWEVFNNTPFLVERGFLRDLDGAERWIVVVKGTFDVGKDGRLREAGEQSPPGRAPVWTGEPGLSSLEADTDFVLERTGTDILIQGHAYATRGRSVPSVEAGFRIGRLQKLIRAFGVRAWMRGSHRGVVPGPARPLDRVPLVYEEAFGGIDPDAPRGAAPQSMQNPAGRGFRHDVRALIDRPAHRLDHLKEDGHGGPYDRPPAGFGPIAPSWTPRAQLAGTYDETWKKRRAPLWPKDLDLRFFRSAPPDQQLPTFLLGGEIIELFNLTPDSYLRVQVPDLSLTMRTIFTDGEESTKAHLHTVVLRPDEARAQLIWYASCRCHGREHRLTRAIVHWEGGRDWLLAPR